MAYKTFIRDWWKEGKYGQLEPYPDAPIEWCEVYAREEDALEACREHAENNDPGRYSRKMEYTSDY